MEPTVPVVIPRFESRRYDGTNGDALVDWLSGTVDLVSDDGQELVVRFNGERRRVPVGWWIIAGGGGKAAFYTEQTPDDYLNYWLELPA